MPLPRRSVASLLAALAAACSRGPVESEAAPGAALGRDTVVIALGAEPRDLFGPLAASTAELAIADAIAPPLFGAEFDCNLRFRPGLARAWAWSEDGRTLDVALRDDLRWPDRSPVTARDVAYSWNLVVDPALASPRASLAARMEPPVAVDDTHLRFRWSERFDASTMLAHAGALGAAPSALLRGPGVERQSLRQHALATTTPSAYGPWKVVSREPGKGVVLEPNEGFAGPAADRPRLAQVRFEVIPDYAARLDALESGAVDVMDGLQPADADRIAAAVDGIRVRRRGWRSVNYLAWNNARPLFADREVRRALAMALDPDRMIRVMLSAPSTGDVYGRPAVSTVTPALCGLHGDAIQRIAHDLKAAKARLAELGWADSNRDGVLDRDGVPFRFTLLAGDHPRRARGPCSSWTRSPRSAWTSTWRSWTPRPWWSGCARATSRRPSRPWARRSSSIRAPSGSRAGS